MKFARMISLTLGAIVALTSCTQSEPIASPKQTIKIGGSSEAYPMMKIFTEAYAAEKKTLNLNFFSPVKPVGEFKGSKMA